MADLAARIVHAVIVDRSIGNAAFRLYCLLRTQADGEGRCAPSITWLADQLGMKDRAVWSRLQELEASGHVIREERPGRPSVFHTAAGSASFVQVGDESYVQGSPNGADSADLGEADLDRILYARGKALLGKNAGGQITKLKNKLGIYESLAVIEQAKRKENAAEYVAGVINRRARGRDVDLDEIGRRVAARLQRSGDA